MSVDRATLDCISREETLEPMTELKPCPFCGAIATSEVRVTQMGDDTDNIDFSIVCSSCGTCKTMRLKIAKTCVFLEVEKAMMGAIEAWNKRAEPWKGENE